MKSIFTNKAIVPTNNDLMEVLSDTYAYWQRLIAVVKEGNTLATEEWAFSSEKYGWSFRVRDKKRVIVYLLPRKEFFKVSMVFGAKATTEIMNSNIANSIKTEINNARVYAEGRGIRLDIKDGEIIEDVAKLICIKIAC